MITHYDIFGITTLYQVPKTPVLQMGASSITTNGSVKTLGVILDDCFNMYEHVT